MFNNLESSGSIRRVRGPRINKPRISTMADGLGGKAYSVKPAEDLSRAHTRTMPDSNSENAYQAASAQPDKRTVSDSAFKAAIKRVNRFEIGQ